MAATQAWTGPIAKSATPGEGWELNVRCPYGHPPLYVNWAVGACSAVPVVQTFPTPAPYNDVLIVGGDSHLYICDGFDIGGGLGYHWLTEVWTKPGIHSLPSPLTSPVYLADPFALPQARPLVAVAAAPAALVSASSPSPPRRPPPRGPKRDKTKKKPDRGTREGKWMARGSAASRAAFAALGAATEITDLIDAVYFAMPAWYRKKVFAENDGFMNPFDKMMAIKRFGPQMDANFMGRAIFNALVANAIDVLASLGPKAEKKFRRELFEKYGAQYGHSVYTTVQRLIRASETAEKEKESEQHP